MTHHSSRFIELADTRLSTVDQRVTGQWATPVTWRQPIHTCYVPVDLLSPDTPESWSATARATVLSAVDTAAKNPERLGRATAARHTVAQRATEVSAAETLAAELGVRESDIPAVARLSIKKLWDEPIEDLRIDCEDGFTQRHVPESEKAADEDARALIGAQTLAQWFRAQWCQTQPNSQTQPPAPTPAFAGIRFKSFDPSVRARGLRTLVTVLDELHDQGILRELYDPASENHNPRALRLTFPKVQHHTQVETLVEVLTQLEHEYGLSTVGGRIRFEVQVETPQAIMGPHGESEAARIIAAADGRCLSLHYGTYDYSASMGVDAAQQSMEHPVADYAKDMLHVATAATGVELSDGSTNRIPTGDRDSIMAGWKLHYRLVSRHLRRGIRQGWDLHANQLVTRHMATIAYFREHWEETAYRLRDYLTGDTSRWMDEPATAKAMSGYLHRAYACGAITDEELAGAGIDTKDLEKLQITGRS